MKPITLVADSGSSKTNWGVVGSLGSAPFSVLTTIGLNPNVLGPTTLALTLSSEVRVWANTLGPVHQVFFYGSGCSDAQMSAVLSNALLVAFPSARVNVEHDLLGAARAVAGHTPAIVCILGTGSSACAYDGERIVRTRGANGYWFADWGGGVDIGRRLLDALLDGDLPPSLSDAFVHELGQEPLAFRHQVYQTHERPNWLVAKLARFAASHIEMEGVGELVTACFDEFARRVVLPLRKEHPWPCRAVGSVAAGFQPLLALALAQHGVSLESADADPLPGLLRYHTA